MKKVIGLIVMGFGLLSAQSANPSYPVFIVSDSIVRPNNATPYSANDVVNDTASANNRLFRFKWALRPNSNSSIVLSSSLEVDSGNTTNGSFRLLLFSDTVGTAADNAAWTPAYANNANFLGSIDYSLDRNQAAGAGAAMSYVTGLNIPFHSIEGGRFIWGVLIAKAAYTPKTLGKYRIKLGLLRY